MFVSASTSSLPNWAELVEGSDSEQLLGDDNSKRLYSVGVYLSKLEPSLLVGLLLDLSVRV